MSLERNGQSSLVEDIPLAPVDDEDYINDEDEDEG